MNDLTEAEQNEYRQSMNDTDDKGRALAHTMTDRAIAEESLILLRAFGDALQALGENPMLKAMMPKFGK